MQVFSQYGIVVEAFHDRCDVQDALRHDFPFQTRIQIKDGEFIKADFIITATELTLLPNLPFSIVQVTSIDYDLNSAEWKIGLQSQPCASAVEVSLNELTFIHLNAAVIRKIMLCNVLNFYFMIPHSRTAFK